MAPKDPRKLKAKAKTDDGAAALASKKIKKKTKPRSGITANWAKSMATQSKLEELAESGVLPLQSEIEWRGTEEETRPSLQEGEVICFLEHVTRGFRPPGHPFFRDLLLHYEIGRAHV